MTQFLVADGRGKTMLNADNNVMLVKKKYPEHTFKKYILQKQYILKCKLNLIFSDTF